MTKSTIFFDGGGSGIRAQARSTSTLFRDFPGFSHGEASLVDYLSDVVNAFAKEVATPISRAVLAVATLPAKDEQYNAIAKNVLGTSSIDELWICSDRVSSCIGAIDGDGVVIAAGTGITALAVGKNRSMIHSLSGDGFLIGDEASGYWIGKMGLNAALRAWDGRGGDQELLTMACEYFQTHPYQLAHIVHQHERPVATIATFAYKVSEFAMQGNKTAIAILDSAAEEVALIATTAKDKCEGDEKFQIALVGGVLKPDSFVYATVEKKLTAIGLSIHKNGKSPLEGAGLLAELSEPGVFAPLIRTFSRNRK